MNHYSLMIKKKRFLLLLFYLTSLTTSLVYTNQYSEISLQNKKRIDQDINNMTMKDLNRYCHELLLKKKHNLSIYCYECSLSKFREEINSTFPQFYNYLAYNYIMIGDLTKAEELLTNGILFYYFEGKEPVNKEYKKGYEIIRLNFIIHEFLSASTIQSLEKAYEYAQFFKKEYPDIKDDKFTSADNAIEAYRRTQGEIKEEKKRKDSANEFFRELINVINKKDKDGLYNLLKRHSINVNVLENRFSYYIDKFYKDIINNVEYKIISINDAHPKKSNQYKYWLIKYNIIINPRESKNINHPVMRLLVIFDDIMIIDSRD